MNTRILLCCIVKMENLYLRDFVEFYKNMGVTNIVLYDNNDVNGEYPQQVIGDYISDGYVIYKDARGKYRYQLEAYDECYKQYRGEYDWIVYFDVDEYIEILNGMRLDEFLSQEKFDNAEIIAFYWMVYGDSGKLHYENKPLYDRFTVPAKQMYSKEKNTFKFIIRGSEYIDIHFTDANAVVYQIFDKNTFSIVHPNGKAVNPAELYQNFSYECAYLKHYQTLTIDEFLCRRFGRRGYADKASDFSKDFVMGIFTTINEMTPEKEKIVEEFFKNYKIEEDLSPENDTEIDVADYRFE